MVQQRSAIMNYTKRTAQDHKNIAIGMVTVMYRFNEYEDMRATASRVDVEI